MRSLRITGSLILVIILLQSCMMPFGMGGMHGNMNQFVMNKSADFMLKLNSSNGDYVQSLYVLIENDGNSKFFIKTENNQTNKFLSNYKSTLNLYRVPYKNANIEQIEKNSVVENLNFLNLQDGEQYISFPTLLKGHYWIHIKLNSIDDVSLDSPLSFNYNFNYNSKKAESENSFLGINYWIWGAAMGTVMTVFMTVSH